MIKPNIVFKYPYENLSLDEAIQKWYDKWNFELASKINIETLKFEFNEMCLAYDHDGDVSDYFNLNIR